VHEILGVARVAAQVARKAVQLVEVLERALREGRRGCWLVLHDGERRAPSAE
jgi:hypothetical protein